MKKLLILLCAITPFALASCSTYHHPYHHPYNNMSNSQSANDARITHQVKKDFWKQHLFASHNVASRTIQVHTINGVVYLSGTATSYEQAQKAINIARSVPGVVRVESTVTVLR